MGREVITIQAGSLANYVGAHFWNIQDELLGLANDPQEGCFADQIEPTVLLRQSEDRQGNVLYMPRAVIFDLNGSLGGASHSSLTGGQASEASSSAAESTWRGQVDVHVAQRVQRSRFVEQLEQEPDLDASEASPQEGQAAAAALAEAARELNADDGVKSWTDFLKVYLHPQSLCLVPGMWQGACDFSGFGHGSSALSSEEFREDALDRVRLFAEECDALQGFQYFVEDLTGFGHLSHDLLQLLGDDYPRSPVMLYALRMPQQPSAVASRERRISKAASLAYLSEVSSLYIPLAPPTSIPCVRWTPGNIFHASALCAAAIEAASTPYRLSENPPRGSLGLPAGACDLASLTELLRPCQSNNLVGAFAAIPCPELPDIEALQAARDSRQAPREGTTQPPFTQSRTLSWTPRMPSGLGEKLAESVVLRGGRHGGQLLQAAKAAEALDAALMQEGTRCVRHRCVAPVSIPIPLAFPDVFQRQCISPQSALASTANGVFFLHCHVYQLDPLDNLLTLCRGARAQQNGARAHISQGQQANGRASHTAAVSSVPALTRLCATPHAGQVAKDVLQDFRGVVRSGPGLALLQGWSYTADDVAEIEERLQQMASCYDNDDSADAF